VARAVAIFHIPNRRSMLCALGHNASRCSGKFIWIAEDPGGGAYRRAKEPRSFCDLWDRYRAASDHLRSDPAICLRDWRKACTRSKLVLSKLTLPRLALGTVMLASVFRGGRLLSKLATLHSRGKCVGGSKR
jgi:hypothetical protein